MHRPAQQSPVRAAFTMLELLVAATVTALTAIAAATLINAICNSSLTTKDLREAKSTGHYALSQFERTIRESRVVGQVTTSTITLWRGDTNSDDQVNLYETAVIRYDSSAQQLIYEYLTPASGGPPPATLVSSTALCDYNTLYPMMPAGDKVSIVWAANVDSLSFSGYPNNTDLRIVDASFTINTNGQSVPFRSAGGPRASGDYLFYSQTRSPPLPTSAQKTRTYYSRWSGFGDMTSGGGLLSFL